MRLSAEEKAQLGKLHERRRFGGSYGGLSWAFPGLVIPFLIVGQNFLHGLHAPDAGKHVVKLCLFAFLAGALLATFIVQAIFIQAVRKREKAMLDLAERHFHEDCPWKEEEAIMREADELQREAKASNLVAAAIHPKRG